MARPFAPSDVVRGDDRLRALKKAHAATQTGPTPRVEDYVEVVYELILEKGYARIVDISAHLHVSSPTATKMIQKLGEDGLVVYERYRGIALTSAGEDLAKKLRRRHDVVMAFLRLLEVDEATANRATEGIEHHLEPATLDRLSELVEYAEANPDWWRQQKKRAQR